MVLNTLLTCLKMKQPRKIKQMECYIKTNNNNNNILLIAHDHLLIVAYPRKLVII